MLLHSLTSSWNLPRRNLPHVKLFLIRDSLTCFFACTLVILEAYTFPPTAVRLPLKQNEKRCQRPVVLHWQRSADNPMPSAPFLITPFVFFCGDQYLRRFGSEP